MKKITGFCPIENTEVTVHIECDTYQLLDGSYTEPSYGIIECEHKKYNNCSIACPLKKTVE